MILPLKWQNKKVIKKILEILKAFYKNDVLLKLISKSIGLSIDENKKVI